MAPYSRYTLLGTLALRAANASCNTTLATARFEHTYNLDKHPFDFNVAMFNVSVFPDAAAPSIDTHAETCVDHPYSFNRSLVLSYKGCTDLAGHDWCSYRPWFDIVKRLHDWKSPVIVLVFLFPRPPFGWSTWVFTLLHLCGDPIDTIASLLYTLVLCRARVRRIHRAGFSARLTSQIVLVITSYEACGLTGTADQIEHHFLSMAAEQDAVDVSSVTLPHCCKMVVDELATDRASPIAGAVVSEFLFVYTFVTQFISMSQSPSGPGNWQVITVHSIAFSLTMLWIIIPIVVAAAIGVSGSKASIRRILREGGHYSPDKCLFPHSEVFEARRQDATPHERSVAYRRTKMPSWRTDKFVSGPATASASFSRSDALSHKYIIAASAISCVAFGTVAAVTVSSLVPPWSWYRQTYELLILATSLTSFGLQCLLNTYIASDALRFRLSLAKDCLSFAGNSAVIVMTQIGILNKCAAWRLGDAMVLPQYQWVIAYMARMNRTVFPAVIFTSIALMFVVAAVLAWVFRDAFAVYMLSDSYASTSDYAWRASMAFTARSASLALTLPDVRAGRWSSSSSKGADVRLGGLDASDGED